jgi:ATP-dependent RNA helicase RhlB
LADLFTRYRINCAILSGDIRQHTRIRTLENFKAGKIRVLVATDVAGRGIHIEGMDHVINYTLPRDPEDYVHRIGRTGRAGAVGTSISFADEDDSFYIPAIEELIGNKLPCNYPQEGWLTPLPPPPPKSKRKRRKRPASHLKRSESGPNRGRSYKGPRRSARRRPKKKAAE